MPLLLAIEYKSKAVVELLLTQDNVNLNPKSALKDTPLLQAMINGHEGVIKLLLAQDGISLNPKGFHN